MNETPNMGKMHMELWPADWFVGLGAPGTLYVIYDAETEQVKAQGIGLIERTDEGTMRLVPQRKSKKRPRLRVVLAWKHEQGPKP